MGAFESPREYRCIEEKYPLRTLSARRRSVDKSLENVEKKKMIEGIFVEFDHYPGGMNAMPNMQAKLSLFYPSTLLFPSWVNRRHPHQSRNNG